jgi:hypothetical protein
MIAPDSETDLPAEATASSDLPVQLFVRVPETVRTPPWALARWLGLERYSQVLLGTSARIEMNVAALVLVGVICFELLIWVFATNALFNAGISEVSWSGTPFGAALAVLIAFVIFFFERQFLTMDDEDRSQRRKAMRIRIGFIVAAAIVTAQPLELLILREPIQQRIHAEGIRGEAAEKLLILGLAPASTEASVLPGLGIKSNVDEHLDQTFEFRRLEEAERALEDALRGRDRRELGLDRLKRELRYLIPSAVPGDAAFALRQSLTRQIDDGEVALAATNREATRLQSQRDAAEQQVRLRRVELEKLAKDAAEERQRDETRLLHWIGSLKRAKPGRLVDELDGDWSYRDPRYGFFEEFRVLYDLLFARPPRWVSGTTEHANHLQRHYGLSDPRPCTDKESPAATEQATHFSQEPTQPCNSLEWRREQAQSKVYWLTVVAGHLIALFVPFLVLSIKMWLMPRELEEYYSRRHQAEAGDPDALLSVMVEEVVRRRPAETGYGVNLGGSRRP